jgi:Domain of unknown function (DUF4384)
MNSQMEHPLVVALNPDSRRLFGFLGRPKAAPPPRPPDTELYLMTLSPQGKALRKLEPRDAEDECSPENCFFCVFTKGLPFDLGFSDVLSDARGQHWDVAFSGVWTVTDGRRLLEDGVMNLVSPAAPFTRARAEGWVTAKTNSKVRDAVQGRTIEELRELEALPLGWWKAQFNSWLAGCGLSVELAPPIRWESAQAAAAEAARRKEEEARQLAEETARGHQAALAIQEETARFELNRHRLETEQADAIQRVARDRELSEKAREQQLLEMEEQFKQRRVNLQMEHQDLESKLLAAIADSQKQAAERQLAIARVCEQEDLRKAREAETRMRQTQVDQKKFELELVKVDSQIQKERLGLDQERRRLELELRRRELEVQAAAQRLERDRRAVTDAQALNDQAAARQQETLDSLKALRQTFNDLAGIFKPLLWMLLDGSRRYTAVGWAEAARFDPEKLAALGFVTPQVFFDKLRRKGEGDGTPILLRKVDVAPRLFPTRDVLAVKDVGPVQAEVIRKGQSLAFELKTRRSGHLTFFNPGTTGRIWLHVPNVHEKSGRVAAGGVYWIPGPELLPPEALRIHGLDLAEAGPAGWEYLVVIVSDQPLIEPGIVARSRPDTPMIQVSLEELDAMGARLESWNPASWTAAVKKFYVED